MVRSSLKGSQCQGLRRGAWTEEEDSRLRKCIEKYGTGKWRLVPKMAGLNRCRKSCRLRWINYLSPGIKRGRFDEDEDELIIRLHKLLGNRWSLIAGRIPGRTANDVKNYWNSHLSKKMEAEHKNVIATDAEIRKPHAQTIPIEWGCLKEPISDETKYEEAKFDISILPAALDNSTALADSIIIHEGSNSEFPQVGFNMSKLDANPNFEGIQGLGDDFLREIGGWEEFLLDLDVWGDLGIF